MILGSQCTRHCRFCNITALAPEPVDPDEPARVAKAARKLNLSYVVVTSVTRDDLADGGAAQFAAVIQALKQTPGTQVEVLIPDFAGNINALQTVIDANPDVINHNIETVASLYDTVRPEARYQRSLELLSRVRKLAPDMPVKSGIMVGVGETTAQLVQTFQDLFDHGCSILTIGQYLQPTVSHLPVKAYYSPDQFRDLEKTARRMGFKQVASGPFVRSSYKARDLFHSA
jgi:lipoic acid synthetase